MLRTPRCLLTTSTRRIHADAAPLLQRSAFNGRLKLERLATQPLEELRSRSEARGLCDAAGRRLPGAPWGFQLAHGSLSPFPVLRTVGFQQVTADTFTFLLRRRPDSESRLPIAACYVEGLYMSGDVCEQWRCEGIAVVQPAAVLETAPKTSLATIMAAVQKSGTDARHRVTIGPQENEELRQAAGQQQSRLASRQVDARELDESIVTYAVSPVRVELLVGSPDHGPWERVEWRREVGSSLQSRGIEDGPWGAPRRLAPY